MDLNISKRSFNFSICLGEYHEVSWNHKQAYREFWHSIFFAENKESHEEILHYLHNPWNVFRLTSAVETAIF